jgi:DNA mismatch repair protein MutS
VAASVPATQVAAADAALPAALVEELRRVDPRELLVPAGTEPPAALRSGLARTAFTAVAPDTFAAERLAKLPEGLDAGAPDPASRAAAALLHYVSAHQPFALAHVSRLRHYTLADAMILDAATRAHLELFRNSEDGGRERTLFERLDVAQTPLGSRRLSRWLAYPLVSPAAIAERQAGVAALADRDRPRARLRQALRPVRDLERLLAKAARPTASPRDLVALRGSLAALPAVAEAVSGPDEEALPTAASGLPPLLPIPPPQGEAVELLREAIVEDPPALPRGSRGALETGYIREGFHAGLDGLREGVRKGREWIAGLEAEERARTGIASLKIRFHPVHGYAIELTKAQLARAPADYERKQTLANAERFTTPALREMEQRVRGGTEQAAALEREIFERVRTQLVGHAHGIREAAEAVAVLDATAALAEVARRDGWVRPEVDDGCRVEIRAGRHPVVEPLLSVRGADAFVPNDTDLDPAERQLLVLTGPNMSGKSTYLRQVALIVLLAQMGSFVPAQSARIGVVDRVFTRVGASDRLARGESTFMVEMRETAEILREATRRSLVILDEIGRGTSTFDGLSIAWAVAEHLHDAARLGCRTLFATHYHELADLSRTKPRVVNAHFEAREWGDTVLFLRRLVPGSASRSYGIQVARLAGLPTEVIARAREILANLEGGELDELGRPRLAEGSRGEAPPDQLALFPAGAARPSERAVAERLREIDPHATTPLQALALLAELRERLEEDA